MERQLEIDGNIYSVRQLVGTDVPTWWIQKNRASFALVEFVDGLFQYNGEGGALIDEELATRVFRDAS